MVCSSLVWQVWGSLCFLELDVCYWSQKRELFSSSNMYSAPLLHSSPSGTTVIWMLVWLVGVRGLLNYPHFFSFFFLFVVSNVYYSVFQLTVVPLFHLVYSCFHLVFFNVSYYSLHSCFIVLYSFQLLLKTTNFLLHVSMLCPSSFIIFMIITLNSFLVRWLISTSLSSSSVVFFFHHLEHGLLLPCFSYPVASMTIYLVDFMYFLTLEKWPFVGDIQCIPATHCPLITRAVCLRSYPYVGCVVPAVLVGWLVWATG